MKNFIFLYEGGDPDWHQNTTPEDMQAQMQQWEEWMTALSEKGQLISGGDPLHQHGTRLSAGGVATDIAASEYKDLISGYSIVSAASMKDALELAKTCPVFSDDSVVVQVREILDMSE